MEKVDLDDCWSISVLVKHADQPVIRTQCWSTGQEGEHTSIYSIWCESCSRTVLWEDSSFPDHSQQQWGKTKTDKAEAAAGTIVLWLAPPE